MKFTGNSAAAPADRRTWSLALMIGALNLILLAGGGSVILSRVRQVLLSGIERSLVETGRASALMMEQPAFDNKAVLLTALVSEAGLEAAWLADASGRSIADSRVDIYPGQYYAHLAQDQDMVAFASALAGSAYVTALRQQGNHRFLRAFIPVHSTDGMVKAVLVIEAAARLLQPLGRIRVLLVVLVSGSLLVTIILILAVRRVLLRVMRRDAQLRVAERSAFMGRMAGYLAHEIRNPLTVIRMTAQVVLMSASEELEQPYRDIMNETDRLDRMTTRFLAAARGQDLEFDLQHENLSVLVRSICSRWPARLGDISLDCICPDHAVYARVDADAMRQMLDNLLDNAANVLADRENGAITVRVKAPEAGEQVIITVRDNGPGMSESMRAKALAPFWSTRPEGSGLGLALVTTLIDGHGGRIELESPKEGGLEAVLILDVDRET